MFLFARLTSRAPQVMTTFLIFSLSAGVLGGILFYLDSSSPNVLEDVTEDVTVDLDIAVDWFFYNQNATTISDIEDAIDIQTGVASFETLTVLNAYDREEEREFRYRTYLGVNDSFFETFPSAISVSDNISQLTDTTCFVEEQTMHRKGLAIGDNYTANATEWAPLGLRIRYELPLKIIGTFKSTIFMQSGWSWYEPLRTTLRIITTRDALTNGFDEVGHDISDGVHERMWVNLDTEDIVSEDPLTAVERLDNLRRQLEQSILPFASVYQFNLINSISDFVSWTASMRTLVLAFSIPSVVMGVMLVNYNSNLLADEQRRDIGTLKTRGASGWQALRWIFGSALLTGFVGSVGAVLVGTLAAFLSGTVKTFMSFNLSQLSELTMIVQPAAILTVFLFSFVVGIIIALPGAIKALLMSATEAHSVLESDVLAKTEKMGNPLIDIILLGIGGFLVTPFLQLTTFGFLSLQSSIWMFAMLVPSMALFVIAFARVLSRPAAAIKARVLRRFRKPPLSISAKVMSRTVYMFRQSEAMGVMFIAMVFTAGVFSAISATTGFTHMQNLHQFQVGADIAIDVDSNLENVTIDTLESITAIEGVSDASAMLILDAYVSYMETQWDQIELRNRSMSVYALQPAKFIQTAFILPYFTFHNDPETAFSILAQNPTNIITSFRPIDHHVSTSLGYEAVFGEEMTVYLRGDSWRNVTQSTIVDVMAENDLGVRTYLPGAPDASSFIVMNLDYIHACLNTSKVSKFYVKLEPGANHTEVIGDLLEIAPYSFEAIESPNFLIEQSLESHSGRSIYGVYTLNVVFSLLYLTVGMVIVSTIRVKRLRKQFSVLRALGAESSSILNTLLVDSMTGLVISAVVGSLLGLILSGMILSVPLVYLGSSTSTLWGRLPVLLAVPIEMLAGMLIATFLFSLVTVYLVTRRALELNIAEEIQYAE